MTDLANTLEKSNWKKTKNARPALILIKAQNGTYSVCCFIFPSVRKK